MVNSIVGGYLADSFVPEYQGLRDQLMEILDDQDLGLRLGGIVSPSQPGRHRPRRDSMIAAA